jgi:hypothetical protein
MKENENKKSRLKTGYNSVVSKNANDNDIDESLIN